MKRTRLAVLLVVALAPAVFADQVTLKNGDRLSGTIITSDAKTLVLKTEYADAVTIKWDFVQQVESGQPLYIRTKAGQVIPGSVTTSGDKLDVATKESGSVAVAKADVTSLRNADEEKKAEAALERLQHPRLADSWTGSLDTGLGLVRGNSESSNFTFGLNAARATTRDKITYYTVSAFARSTVNGVAGGAAMRSRTITRRLTCWLAPPSTGNPSLRSIVLPAKSCWAKPSPTNSSPPRHLTKRCFSTPT